MHGFRLARRIAYALRQRSLDRVAWIRRVGEVEGTIAWGVRMAIHPASALTLGAASSLNHGTILAVKPGPRGPGVVQIGTATYVGEYNNLRSEGDELRIGDGCLISQFVSLIATGHGFQRRDARIADQGVSEAGGIAIGDDVWIGSGAVVLPGMQIGSGAVVAANAFVTETVEPYKIVAGVPARVVGERS